MSMSKRWVDWAVKLHAQTAQAAGAVYVDGIRSVTLNPGLQSSLEASDGSPYATFASLTAGAPTGSFETTDLKALLDECSAFMAIDDDGTHPGIEFFLQSMAQGGTRSTGSAIKLTIGNGILALSSLELSHQAPAVLSAEVTARKDGVTAPLAVATGETLPATVYPATSVIWSLGKVVFNGTEIDGLESVSIEFGIEVEAEAADGDVYPTFAMVRQIRPTITLKGVHVDLLSTLSVDGAFYTASQVVIYARKRAEGGTYVADATAEHVSFTLGKCRVDPGSIDGDPKSISLTLSPYYTAGGSPVLPITINTATAIA